LVVLFRIPADDTGDMLRGGILRAVRGWIIRLSVGIIAGRVRSWRTARDIDCHAMCRAVSLQVGDGMELYVRREDWLTRPASFALRPRDIPKVQVLATAN